MVGGDVKVSKSKVSFIPGYMQQDMYDRDKQCNIKNKQLGTSPHSDEYPGGLGGLA